MPILSHSSYRRSPFLFNGHLESIYPALFRKVDIVYERERFILSDGDFVDLDWLDNRSRKLVVLTHGLEGDSSRQYVAGMARFFSEKNWDVLAWNCRSCSGEMNIKKRLYHHGEIGDIGEVIGHALKIKDYKNVALIGFSMGGNINLKYVGVNGKELNPAIKSCVAFSCPTDLASGSEILNIPSNIIYKKKFLKNLSIKIKKKNEQFPGIVDLNNLKKVKVWKDFDNYFSAPLIGVKNADEFYKIASARNFMPDIKIPTLIIQAKNDPILPEACFPTDICERHRKVFLEMPRHGGHCGFWRPGEKVNWAEKRAFEFCSEYAKG